MLTHDAAGVETDARADSVARNKVMWLQIDESLIALISLGHVVHSSSCLASNEQSLRTRPEHGDETG
jgi:hypothetical protein